MSNKLAFIRNVNFRQIDKSYFLINLRFAYANNVYNFFNGGMYVNYIRWRCQLYGALIYWNKLDDKSPENSNHYYYYVEQWQILMIQIWFVGRNVANHVMMNAYHIHTH